MKIDLHVHCLPVSRCAQFPEEAIPALLRKAGIGGYCLCNHYYPAHLEALGETLPEQIEGFIACYERSAAAAEALGIHALFGAEVKMIRLESHPEFLLYGLTPEILREALPLYAYSQEQLYDYCRRREILLYQAHPYRTEQGYCPADPSFMDGIEVFNGHAKFAPKYERTLAFAEEHGLALSAGSDLHDPEDLGLGGIVIEKKERVEDALSLRDYLRSHRAPELYFRADPH